MNDKENELFEQNMSMIMGMEVKNNQPKLSREEKQKIGDSYTKMFLSLSMTNWLRGDTLGGARYKANEQIKSFIKSKNPNNPVAITLQEFSAAHQVRLHKQIMTDRNKDRVCDVPESTRAKMQKRSTDDLNKTLLDLNAMLGRWDNINVPTKQEQMNDAQKKLQTIMRNKLMAIMAQKQQGRAA